MRFVLLFLISAVSFGCVKRTINIQSSPAGALVWLNDREVGRTPIELDFLYYGEYDLRVELDGYRPIMTTRWVTAPAKDLPFVDLIFEAINPNAIVDVHWSVELQRLESNQKELIQRAKSFKTNPGVNIAE